MNSLPFPQPPQFGLKPLIGSKFVFDPCWRCSLWNSWKTFHLNPLDILVCPSQECNTCSLTNFYFTNFYSGIFYSCQLIKSFRPFHSFWEEEDLSREINTSFTEWHHYHIMNIQFQGHPVYIAMAFIKKFHVCFYQFLIITKTFRGSQLLKYLIKIELIWLTVTKHKPKLLLGLTCHFMLDRLHWCAKQRNRTSVPWASCDIHISPFSIIYTKP